MSTEERRRFISKKLSEGVNIKGINCQVRLTEMFTKLNTAVVVLRKKNGNLLALGI